MLVIIVTANCDRKNTHVHSHKRTHTVCLSTLLSYYHPIFTSISIAICIFSTPARQYRARDPHLSNCVCHRWMYSIFSNTVLLRVFVCFYAFIFIQFRTSCTVDKNTRFSTSIALNLYSIRRPGWKMFYSKQKSYITIIILLIETN